MSAHVQASRWFGAVSLLASALGACSDLGSPFEPAQPTEYTLAGEGQSTRVGLRLPNPVVFTVLDQHREPVRGLDIRVTSAG